MQIQHWLGRAAAAALALWALAPVAAAGDVAPAPAAPK